MTNEVGGLVEERERSSAKMQAETVHSPLEYFEVALEGIVASSRTSVKKSAAAQKFWLQGRYTTS